MKTKVPLIQRRGKLFKQLSQHVHKKTVSSAKLILKKVIARDSYEVCLGHGVD